MAGLYFEEFSVGRAFDHLRLMQENRELQERSSLVPDMPTLAESGIPGYESSGWFGILAPAGTPPAVLARLNTEITAVLRLPEIRERFAAAALEPLPSTPEQMAQFMKSEAVKWAKVIKDSGAKVD